MPAGEKLSAGTAVTGYDALVLSFLWDTPEL
jgi:hypothetical protein